MKIISLISLNLSLLLSNAFSQGVCLNNKIQSPVVSKPAEAAIVSTTCSTLLVKWKGNADQSYVVHTKYIDPATSQEILTDAVTNIACDNDHNCTATIPVVPGSNVSWSVQAIGMIDNRTFYSYPLRGDQNYAIPPCGQPLVAVETPASIEKKSDLTISPVRNDLLTVSNDKLAMYPNPVTNILNVKFSSEYKGKVKLTIMDISGKAVKTIDVNKQQSDYMDHITVNSLRPGMYFVNIQMQNGRSLSTRFIKN